MREGTETVRDYPGGRFDYIDRTFTADSARRGIVANCRGGFLPEVDRFDAGFFGISPREAALLDPQQRLLLEVAWEAVEDAGVPVSKLAGSRTGVFIGLWTNDYEHNIYELCRDHDFYGTTGGGRYPASGRLAYFLDLRGPNLTLDTACSSSLVAIHLACQSLLDGQSEMALAGGVNIILRPEVTLSYSAAKMLSIEGRCKFGDAAADGYVRSEGAGIVLLKPLSRAIADGDSIYAVIRGSAVNNDGKSSGLLISPSREGQKDMLRTALRDAGVSPASVDYIEAHGTGTLAGDPVEIEAIRAVVGESERQRPCAIGSVKTNLGHTESAAGAAALIKVALSLERGLIPASLNFSEPNPKIAWDEKAVVIQSAPGPWPQSNEPSIAGVSGFGITGTNAHVVLQGFPAPQHSRENSELAQLILLSAQTQAALEARAASWRDRLAADPSWPASLADLAYTAAVRRTHHDFRLAVVARNRQELREQLVGWLAKQERSGVRSRKVLPAEARRAVFVFPGQGGQWIGMGRTLLRDEPVFCNAMAACDVVIQKYTGWTVTSRLLADDASGALTGIDVIQPVLFAVMVSLAALWRSYGVEPEAVVGHSMGEAAAAAVSGALSLDDAAAVICYRSRLMKNASGRGLMAVAELSLEESGKLVSEYGGRISVAANNSPTSTVFSGDADAIEDVLAKLEGREIFCRRIKVDVASHSAHMDPFRKELTRLLRDIRPQKASIPLYSTTTGAVEDGTKLNADYWSRNLRQPVLFSSAVQSLLKDGFDTFIEINSHPVLLQAIEDGIRHAERDAVAVTSLRREKQERPELLDALGTLHAGGFPIQFDRLYPQGACLRLPPYPWQRERHWIEADQQILSGSHGVTAHPNLGSRVELSVAPGTHLWEANLRLPAGSTDVAALLIDLAFAAVSESLGDHPFALEDLEFPGSSKKDRSGQIVIAPLGEGCWSLQILARQNSGWSPRCTGLIRNSAVEANGALPHGESRNRVVDDDDGSPLAACFKLAAEALAERSGAGSLRVCKIARITRRENLPHAKRIVQVVLRDVSEVLQADCQLQLETGEALLDISRIQFGVADEPDSADSIYDLQWIKKEVLPESGVSKGSWILLGDPNETSSKLAIQLQGLGDNCLYVSGIQGLGQAIESLGADCRGAVCVSRTKGADPQDALNEAFEIVQVVQALAEGQTANPPRLWMVSAGAWNLPGDSPDCNAAQGAVWGLGRVIAREHPELSGTNVDLCTSTGDKDFETLARLLRQNGAEDQIAVRGGECFVARLKPHADLEAAKQFAVSPNATYLITGGMGGIGVELARWLVSLGARHLALIGRRPPNPAVRTQLDMLESSGAALRIFNADVTDLSGMSAVFQEIAATMPPLRGVFHLAVATDGVLINALTKDRLEGVLRPKALGAWTLHRLTEGLQLDCFVLFSSVACVLSQPGQASYAAANAYLDALARYRHAQGLPASSIQWGPWAGVGLAREEGALRSVRAYQAQGVRSLPLPTALDALASLLREDSTNNLVLPVRWDEFARSFAGDKVPNLFLDLAASASPAVTGEPLKESIREKLLEVPAGRARRALLEDHLQKTLAAVLKADASRMDPTKPLGSLGVDSLMALQFVRRLAISTSVKLPATAIFNYPTLRLLETELARRMEISLDSETAALPATFATEVPVAEISGVSELSEEETISVLMDDGRVK